jgi:hypothetical protein
LKEKSETGLDEKVDQKTRASFQTKSRTLYAALTTPFVIAFIVAHTLPVTALTTDHTQAAGILNTL